jgi:hypothetical protein
MSRAETPINNEQIKREEMKLAVEKVMKANDVGKWGYLYYLKENEDGKTTAVCSFQLKYEEIAKKIDNDLKELGFNSSYENNLSSNVVIIL